MPHLICYDISGNSLRQKMATNIIASGLDRINKSVYLGTISDSSLKSLENNLGQLLSTKGEPSDSVIIIPVHAQQIQEMRILGLNELDKEELSGTKSTMMIQEDEDHLEAELAEDYMSPSPDQE